MNKVITILVVLFSIQGVFAADPALPPPTPAPPPGLPIDGGLVVLFVFALISGYYLSKKYISTKKGSL
ncbi:PID-CTERM protein-sorting domain-containing protein [Flavobacterium sp.]|uniref:PID-CTERM protein-sorting domain-containing protein n=1 Tax=Flavobacterium sp. TaxID=239 RepID=UPI0040481DF9